MHLCPTFWFYRHRRHSSPLAVSSYHKGSLDNFGFRIVDSIVRTFELRSSTQRCVVRKFKTWAEISENSTDIWYCWVLTVRADQLRWNLLNYLLESSGFSSQYSTTAICVGERRKATTFQFGKYFADILVLDISKFINFIHSLTRLPKEALKTLFPPELQR